MRSGAAQRGRDASIQASRLELQDQAPAWRIACAATWLPRMPACTAPFAGWTPITAARWRHQKSRQRWQVWPYMEGAGCWDKRGPASKVHLRHGRLRGVLAPASCPCASKPFACCRSGTLSHTHKQTPNLHLFPVHTAARPGPPKTSTSLPPILTWASALRPRRRTGDTHPPDSRPRCLLPDLGLSVAPQEVDRMIQLLDRDGDRRICYQEFRRFVVLLPGGAGSGTAGSATRSCGALWRCCQVGQAVILN